MNSEFLQIESMSEQELVMVYKDRVKVDSEGHISELDFSNLGLTHIPFLKLPYLKKLDLSDNKIKILENISYPLDWLDISDNPLIFLARTFKPKQISFYNNFKSVSYSILSREFWVDPEPYFELVNLKQWARLGIRVKPQPLPSPLPKIPSFAESSKILTDRELFTINFEKGIPKIECDGCCKKRILYSKICNSPFHKYRKIIYYNTFRKNLTMHLCRRCYHKLHLA